VLDARDLGHHVELRCALGDAAARAVDGERQVLRARGGRTSPV
jgi:hypothetical protein